MWNKMSSVIVELVVTVASQVQVQSSRLAWRVGRVQWTSSAHFVQQCCATPTSPECQEGAELPGENRRLHNQLTQSQQTPQRGQYCLLPRPLNYDQLVSSTRGIILHIDYWIVIAFILRLYICGNQYDIFAAEMVKHWYIRYIRYIRHSSSTNHHVVKW